MEQPIIRFLQVDKQFTGVHALKNVSFDINKGEIHALIGENGAGKSTLLNILHGVYQVTSGNVEVEGKIVDFKTPVEALQYGIAKVHQEVQVVSTLTVGQNIVLGFEPKKGLGIDFKKLYRETDEILRILGCKFKSTDPVQGLSVGELQMIAIAKAIFHKARIISLDEPTASLSETEIEALFAVVNKLRKQGVTFIYVSHKLDELFEISDRISVLRDGQYIGTYPTDEITRDELIKNMVGRSVSNYAQRMKPSCVGEDVVLSVKGLTGEKFEDISFDLHKGEILGLSGLVGAGRTEIVRAIFGVDATTAGSVELDGKVVNAKTPQEALKAGIGFLSENRKQEGFIPSMSNEKNVSFASLDKFSNSLGIIDFKAMRVNFEHYAEEVELNIRNPEHLTVNLSGGNQQKVILAKWLTTNSKVIIFDEPTKGVDVGAKAEIYRLMEEYVHQGNAIIMVSSELTEVMGMSDNILVVSGGRIKGRLSREEFNEETILKYALPEE